MDDATIIILSILGAVLYLLLNYAIASEFYSVACLKGHTEKKYLWISFFLGIIGYLLVIALPDRNQTPTVNPSVEGGKRGGHTYNTRRGPHIEYTEEINSNADGSSSFINEIEQMSTDDLMLILKDQRDLYTEKELEIIAKVLKTRDREHY